MVKHGALSKSHVQQLLRSKDARVRRAAFTLLEMSNPRLRSNSELFIEITRFIWDANPSYDVYQEFTKRHFQVRYKVHELIAARLKIELRSRHPDEGRTRGRLAAGEIGNMRDLLRRNQQPKYRLIHRNDRVFPPQLFKCRGGVVHGGHAHLIAVVEHQVPELGVANAHRILQHGLEHRFQFTGRTGDDSQNLRGRGLPFQRFGKIGRALAQFVQQPGVLDGDDGLRGEILDQIYLLIVEGSDLLPIDSDRTNQVILLEHRHDQKRPSSGNLGNRLIGIFRSDVGDVCDLPRVSDTVEDTGRATRG